MRPGWVGRRLPLSKFNQKSKEKTKFGGENVKENRIVVADLNWAETVPEWLKEEVKSERLILGLRSVLKPIREVGDAEVCLYLYTAGLRQPLTYELTEVYVHLVGKLLKKRGKEISEEMKEKLGKFICRACCQGGSCMGDGVCWHM